MIAIRSSIVEMSASTYLILRASCLSKILPLDFSYDSKNRNTFEYDIEIFDSSVRISAILSKVVSSSLNSIALDSSLFLTILFIAMNIHLFECIRIFIMNYSHIKINTY